MGDSSAEMVAPKENEENFGFAFNDCDFSDRVLRLVIIPDNEPIDSSKKLRGVKYHEWFSSIHADCSKDSKTRTTRKRKAIDPGSYDGAKVVTLHINSAILAVKSPFFYKLFKNGMRESQQGNDVFLRINASEEASLMDLLKFVYGNKLCATSVTDLVELLIAADKFEVISCMRYCVQMLLKLPMSLEYALFYLELPSSVLMSEIVRPLFDEAKNYVVSCHKDFSKSQKEAMALPLSALEVVLGGEGLEVGSEDDVFDFILKWARVYYPKLEERREILTNRLTLFVHFPNMSSSKLKEALVCPDFDRKQVSKLVMEALFSKAELSSGQHIRAAKDSNFSGRVYNPRCAVHFNRCIVYFNLKKDELKSLLPTSRYLQSHTFCLGGKKAFPPSRT